MKMISLFNSSSILSPIAFSTLTIPRILFKYLHSAFIFFTLKFWVSRFHFFKYVLHSIDDMLNRVQYRPISDKQMFLSHKVLLFLNVFIHRSPTTPKLCFLVKCNQPTLSAKSGTTPYNQKSFTASYLVDNCGFSPETALLLSRRINLKNTQKPDSVLIFLRNYGFSNTQIRRIVKRIPEILLYVPVKSLLPKFEFLRSKGISSSELVEMVTTCPIFLVRSLENHIIPCYDVLKNLLHSDEKAILWIKRWMCLISQSNPKANIQVLIDFGVPQLYVRKLFVTRPLLFLKTCSSFSEGVEKVKELGFNPSHSRFIVAFMAINCMSKAKWERKVEIFKEWGWTEDDIVTAFRRYPNMMMISESKIMKVMNFLVNKMGCDSALVARRPIILDMSLEERIIPRTSIVLDLYSRGLIRKSASLVTPLSVSENVFLQKYVKRFNEEAPNLVNMYEEKLKYVKTKKKHVQ